MYSFRHDLIKISDCGDPLKIPAKRKPAVVRSLFLSGKRQKERGGKRMEKLNPAALAKIDAIVEAHKDQPGPTIVMLHDVQNELGYVPFEAMEKIADACGSSVAEVYGVVMFYAQFTTEPKGKHVINVCLGTACYVKGAQKLIDQAVEVTGAPINGTSKDGLFSLDATRCLGACGLAPVAVVDGRTIGAATTGNKLLNELKKIIAEEKAGA